MTKSTKLEKKNIISHEIEKNQKLLGLDVSIIKNKFKRSLLFQKQKALKKKQKREGRTKRKKEQESLGEDAKPRDNQKTIENTREFDETVVQPNDQEVLADEATDEFSEYFKGKLETKLLITTCIHPSQNLLKFVDDLLSVFPNSHYYKRGTFNVKSICKFSVNREFTDLIIINEDREEPNGLILIHLPNGPTAYFRLSGVKLRSEVRNHSKATTEKPELILNNFNTRLGHSIGRMLSSLFPRDPQLKAREVVTFHNQRDFIFFRFHRYIFENKQFVRLQELGPRFSMKLRTLQRGTFDKQKGEYEWFYKRKMETSHKKFFL